MKCLIDYSDDCEFPIENLPYGVFSTNSNPNKRIGVAIGDKILDLNLVRNLFDGPEMRGKQDVFKETTLNSFMALGFEAWKETRLKLQYLLSDERSILINDSDLRSRAFVLQSEAKMYLPAHIGDYTDFASSFNHVENCHALVVTKSPGSTVSTWHHMPIGYHGRASSIVISGTPIVRPQGFVLPADVKTPAFISCKSLDFELELGFFIGGPPTTLGEPIEMIDAEKRIFGFVLLNDWSARDVQTFEMPPLGPFTSKNFGTSISPWIVTTLALEPFIAANAVQNPLPNPYLRHKDDFLFDIKLEAHLLPENDKVKTVVCKTNFNTNYWTSKQCLVYHTITGCNVNPGDLMGTGTVSGVTPGSLGSLLELTHGGKQPLQLADGSKRAFLKDGDTVTLRGFCEGKGYKIGFGECVGKILPCKAK